MFLGLLCVHYYANGTVAKKWGSHLNRWLVTQAPIWLFRSFLSRKVSARRSVHSPQYNFITTLIISRQTWLTWHSGEAAGLELVHRHTSMKLFRPQHGSLDNRQYALNQGARTDKCWTVRINLEVERTFLALEVLLLLQLFIFIAYFSTVVPITSCVLFPIGLSSLTRHFQHVL